MKTLLMISAATLFGASAALAQDNQTFITLDSNQNGSVSFDEAVIADPSLDRASFDAQDSDGDGSLNVAEFEAWLEGRADAEANADVGVESDVDSDPVEDNPVYDEPQDSAIESEAEIRPKRVWNRKPGSTRWKIRWTTRSRTPSPTRKSAMMPSWVSIPISMPKARLKIRCAGNPPRTRHRYLETPVPRAPGFSFAGFSLSRQASPARRCFFSTLARTFSLSERNCPQAAKMSRPRGVRIGEA